MITFLFLGQEIKSFLDVITLNYYSIELKIDHL